MSLSVEQLNLKIPTADSKKISGLLVRPEDARWLLVLAHGAGAGMRHPFLEKLAGELAAVHVATLRYQFPYMEQGHHSPDPPAVLTSAVRSALSMSRKIAPEVPLLAGGKSMGGRMTSLAAAEQPADFGDVKGLVFFGFPLYPPGRPSTKRAEHLSRVKMPMLFLQGTRDQFADLKLLRPVCKQFREARLHEIDTADHSFHVLKRSGRTDQDVLREIAQTVAAWAEEISGKRARPTQKRPTKPPH
jgi:predicted alpha/beta-hydrolase family hydrolase